MPSSRQSAPLIKVLGGWKVISSPWERLLAVASDADKRMILLVQCKNFALNEVKNTHSCAAARRDSQILPCLELLGELSLSMRSNSAKLGIGVFVKPHSNAALVQPESYRAGGSQRYPQETGYWISPCVRSTGIIQRREGLSEACTQQKRLTPRTSAIFTGS